MLAIALTLRFGPVLSHRSGSYVSKACCYTAERPSSKDVRKKDCMILLRSLLTSPIPPSNNDSLTRASSSFWETQSL